MRAAFIGRFQPLHNGHMWLFSQKLDQGVSVLVMVRDIEPDEKNPLTTRQTVEIIEKAYEGEMVEVMTIPDIESVNYGRGVGYEINEYFPPPDVGVISATEIRGQISTGNDDWKEKTPESTHDLLEKYL